MTEPKTPRRAATGKERWTTLLRKAFPDDQVDYRPAPWCKACLDHPDRCCSRHEKADCPNCDQFVTTAHNCLPYVGHANVTERLLDVDPRWSWEPAYRLVDQDQMLAAIATGNPDIVRLVISNSPPQFDQHGGMWMNVTVHDDTGQPVSRLAYGDAGRRSGPNAIKEVIGDGVRNGAMRAGVGLDMWSKADRAQQQHGVGGAGRDRTIIRALPAVPPAGEQDQPEPVNAASAPAKAFALARLAATLTAHDSPSVGDLQARVWEPARRQGLLNVPVGDVFFGSDSKVRLSQVITEARRRIEARLGAQ